MSDPLIPHLLDILARASADSFILGGGLGLNVKRSHVLHEATPTLVPELPEARATSDIDLFLRLAVFVRPEQGQALRAVLDDLDYSPLTPNWQFSKPLDASIAGSDLVVDLLAREPTRDEGVRVRNLRVGSESKAGLHGRETPEAFAVEASPVLIGIQRGGAVVARVWVPHPYAWINMKLRAAHDWLLYDRAPWPLREGQDPPSGKHAFDVILLLAMLTEAERDESKALAEEFREHAVGASIRLEAATLFETEQSLGWTEAKRRTGIDLDHGLLWEVLCDVLGIGDLARE